MYATGIPAGMMIDAKTPRWGIVLGIFFFGIGYYPIARGMDKAKSGNHDNGLTILSIPGWTRCIQCGVYMLVLLLHRGWELFSVYGIHQSRYVCLIPRIS
jgi:hypothetical protein